MIGPIRQILLVAAAWLIPGCVSRQVPAPEPAPFGRIAVVAAGPKGVLNLREVQTEAEGQVRRAVEFLQLEMPECGVRVVVFPSQRRMRAFLGRYCPKQRHKGAACFELGTDYVVAVPYRTNRQEFSRLLRHELTHYVLASQFYDLPPWVDEGLAQFFEAGEPGHAPSIQSPKAPRLGLVRGRTLDELVAVPAGQDLSRHGYLRSRSLVFHLLTRDKGGAAQMRDYLRKVHSGSQSVETFRTCFGASPNSLSAHCRPGTRR